MTRISNTGFAGKFSAINQTFSETEQAINQLNSDFNTALNKIKKGVFRNRSPEEALGDLIMHCSKFEPNELSARDHVKWLNDKLIVWCNSPVFKSNTLNLLHGLGVEANDSPVKACEWSDDNCIAVSASSYMKLFNRFSSLSGKGLVEEAKKFDDERKKDNTANWQKKYQLALHSFVDQISKAQTDAGVKVL